MARYSKPASYFKGRKCCECDKDISIGKDHGYRRHDEKNNWTGEWLCKGCYIRNYQRNGPESQNNIKKLMRDWRMGNLDPSSPPGKGFIGAQIVAKTLGIDDCNIEMDNFRFFIDLSKKLEV